MILRYWDIDMKDYPDIRILGNWGYEIFMTLNIDISIKMNKDILIYCGMELLWHCKFGTLSYLIF